MCAVNCIDGISIHIGPMDTSTLSEAKTELLSFQDLFNDEKLGTVHNI